MFWNQPGSALPTVQLIALAHKYSIPQCSISSDFKKRLSYLCIVYLVELLFKNKACFLLMEGCEVPLIGTKFSGNCIKTPLVLVFSLVNSCSTIFPTIFFLELIRLLLIMRRQMNMASAGAHFQTK